MPAKPRLISEETELLWAQVKTPACSLSAMSCASEVVGAHRGRAPRAGPVAAGGGASRGGCGVWFHSGFGFSPVTLTL